MAPKILLLDDDQDILYILKTGLQASGYEVTTASDGHQGLQLLKTYVPDLIISDLTMPNMNGWTFSMKARQDGRYQRTPIIILSALLEKETLADEADPATYYMPKPFDVFRLTDKIEELLKNPS